MTIWFASPEPQSPKVQRRHQHPHQRQHQHRHLEEGREGGDGKWEMGIRGVSKLSKDTASDQDGVVLCCPYVKR
jgi:hypothetical protein